MTEVKTKKLTVEINVSEELLRDADTDALIDLMASDCKTQIRRAVEAFKDES